MKTNGKNLLYPIALLIALTTLLVPIQHVFAAQTTPPAAAPTSTPAPKPTSYQVVIDPLNNNRGLLFKGKLDEVELKGWWLDISTNGQALETFLKTRPRFRFVIIARDGVKTEITAEQYLKGGLRFPYGNAIISLFDDGSVPVFENLKIQTGGSSDGSGGIPPDSGGPT